MRWILFISLTVLYLGRLSAASVDTVIITENFANTELRSAFELLENKYALKLAYEESAIRNVRVTCRIDRLGIRPAFERLLRGTSLDFRIVDERHVMIRRAGLSQEKETEAAAFPASGAVTVRGRVVDALSGEALPFASVATADLGQGVAAEEDGRFLLTIAKPEEEITLQVQFLGYYPRTVRLSKDQRERLMIITLHPKVVEIPRITVQEQAPMLASQGNAGRLRIQAEQLGKMTPGFIGGQDLFRALQLLPGIGAADDLSAGLQIRGADSGDNLLLLDGMTLYRVDHFYGIFSAINPSFIGQVDLYKDAFPARFGGRTAGVLEMSSREWAGSKAGGSIELNLMSSHAYLELPLSGDLRLQLGGRISNGDISNGRLFDLANQERTGENLPTDPLSTLSRQALLAQTPDFRFYDGNARLSWTPMAGSRLSLNFFRSYDCYFNDYQNSFINVLPRRRITNTQTYEERADWANTGFSLEGEHRWSGKLGTFLTLSRSAFANYNNLESALFRSDGERSDTTISVSNRNDNNIGGIDIHLRTEWAPIENHNLSFGYQGQQHRVSYLLGVDQATVLSDTQSAWEQNLYTQWQGAWDNQWTIRAGLRGTYYTPTGGIYLSPRLFVRHEPVPGLGIQASLSRYAQFLREIDYENRFGASQPFFVLAGGGDFPVADVNQWTLGAGYTGQGYALELEYFDRHIDGALEYALVLTGFQADQEAPQRRLEYLSFSGEGRTYGIDALLRKTSGALTGWIAYTLSKSTNAFPTILRGRPFPAANDQRHQLKIVGQYQAGMHWQFSSTYVFASGRPYTNLAELARMRLQQMDRGNIAIEDRLSYLDDYHRLDVAGSYQFKLGSATARCGVSVFNLLNRANVKYRQYIFAIPESPRPNGQKMSTVIGNELQQLGRTINLNLGLTF